jgi:hypothetical protein
LDESGKICIICVKLTEDNIDAGRTWVTHLLFPPVSSLIHC